MPHQLTIDELRRSRATDPQTSQDAARRANGLAAAHRQAILATMQRGGSWTAHEVAENCGLTAVQVNRRFAELRDDGAIQATVDTRPTPSGRAAQCYDPRLELVTRRA